MTTDLKPFTPLTIDIFADNKRSSISSGTDLKLGDFKEMFVKCNRFYTCRVIVFIMHFVLQIQ